MKVTEVNYNQNDTIHAIPFKVTAYDVYAAILTVDKLGNKV